MKYLVIQVCCHDCKHFYGVYYCDDIWDLIDNIEGGTDYTYLLYNAKSLKFIDEIDGCDL